MTKRLHPALLLALTLCLFDIALFMPACVQPTAPRALAFLSLKDTWNVVDRAMNVYGEAVVRGRVSAKDQLTIDRTHAIFVAAWREAVKNTGADTTLTPDNVQRWSNELLLLLTNLNL